MESKMMLTQEERAKLLGFEKGFLALYSIRAYESKKILLHEDPEAPLNVYISQALGLDFIKDVYDNEEVQAKNLKVNNEVFRKFGTWHIGDVLTQIVWDFVREISEFKNLQVEAVDGKLKEAWKFFQDLKPKKKRTTYSSGQVELNFNTSFLNGCPSTRISIMTMEDYFRLDLLAGKIKKATLNIEYEEEEE